MTSNFAGQLSAIVPSPSTFVKSSIKRLSYTDHTCGYWAHSLETWMVSSFFPNWIVSAGMLKEGTKQYEHAMRMQKENRTNGWNRDAIRLVLMNFHIKKFYKMTRTNGCHCFSFKLDILDNENILHFVVMDIEICKAFIRVWIRFDAK